MTTSHQKENTVATTKPALRAGALKPVLAGVGVTDLAVEAVRDAVADVQKRVAAVQKDVTGRVAGVQKPDVQASRAAIEARVAELQTEARAYPAKVSTQLTSQLNQFSALVDENVAAASGTYADLVRRGESLVGRIRHQESTTATVSSARTTVTKARTTATQAKRAAEANVEAADKTAATKVAPQSEPTAKKATRQAAAKKATRQAAGKKASATTARKTAARKTTTARSSAKATATAAQKTAANATQAAAEAAEKVGD